MDSKDVYRIDSQKLIYHPQRVSDWLKGKNIYPIYMEVSPSGACNYRCTFCALDFMGYIGHLFPSDIFRRNIEIMAQKGVKSMMLAGEGEPFLNKETPDFINQAKHLGIDVSVTSNCSLFTKEVAEDCLGSLTWIRCSFNAGTEKEYEQIHRCRPGDFQKVLTNLHNMVEVKKAHRLETTIGMQMVLIPENVDSVFAVAALAAEIGVDYFSVKPFSKHPMSFNDLSKEDFQYQEFMAMGIALEEQYRGKLQIVFRTNAMRKLMIDRNYNTCRALPFWAYIDAQARVWGCSAHLGDERFIYGDLHEEDFDKVWEGQRRKESLFYVRHELKAETCREICRMDEINRYLHELKNPGPHVNFI